MRGFGNLFNLSGLGQIFVPGGHNDEVYNVYYSCPGTGGEYKAMLFGDDYLCCREFNGKLYCKGEAKKTKVPRNL